MKLMKNRILRFFKGSKVSSLEIMLLITVWVTVIYKFTGVPDFSSNTEESLIYDYVEPNFSAPHPSQFPYFKD
jgi:hypothetical protein